MKDIQYWLNKYIQNPQDQEINFRLALSYDLIEQTASACGYYIRSVEFGINDDLKYEALLRTALCFEKQGNRVTTIKGILLRAISLQPDRPQAYFLLSRLHERLQEWYESYSYAVIGLKLANNLSSTLTDLEYKGDWLLLFEKAVSGWWIGLFDESINLFKYLNYSCPLDSFHKNLVIHNLNTLHMNCYIWMRYTHDIHDKMKFKFNGSENIKNNYSQAYQDMFALYVNNGKRNGTYLEIGSSDPIHNNNTYLLEKEFQWSGVSIDIDSSFSEKFLNSRKNLFIGKDATKINYLELLKNNYKSNIIDYLQIDCDPPSISFEILKLIPFDKFKFKFITFEHDYYADIDREFREKSRKYLSELGYRCIIKDVSMVDWAPFEDWWIHPDLVNIDYNDLRLENYFDEKKYKVTPIYNILFNDDTIYGNTLNKFNISFIDGPKVEIFDRSSKDKNYNIKFIDNKTQNVIYEANCKYNEWAKSYIRYFVDWKININNGEYIHNFNLKDKKVFISLETKNIGDTIAWIPYVEEFRKIHSCNVICCTYYNQLLKDAYPEIKFINPTETVNDIYVSYYIGFWVDTNTEHRPNNPKNMPLQKVIADILGINYVELKPKIVIDDKKRKIKDKYICISTISTAGCKCWERENGWQDIVDYLNSIGYIVVVIQKEKSNLKNIIDMSGIEDIQHSINLIYNCEFFIGLSSGMSWVAWALNKNVIMISGFTETYNEFKGNNYRIINETVCHGCWNDINIPKIDINDWYWCPLHKGTDRHFECSKNITSDNVIDKIKEILSK